MSLPTPVTNNPFDHLLTANPQPPSDTHKNMRTLGIAAVFLLVLLILAAVVPIGGAVLGNGSLGVETRVKRIAHPTGGVISEILVQNGDHVTEGQLLMRLDNTVVGADASYSAMTLQQLLAQRARLEAEQAGASSIQFPAELTGSATASANQAMAAEAELFSRRRSEASQLRAQLQSRIAQTGEAIRGLEGQIASLDEQRRIIEPELQGMRDLRQRGLVTISRLNQIERTAVMMDGDIAAQRSAIAEQRSKISEIQEQLLQLTQTRRAEAGAELARVNTMLNDQRLRGVAASDQKKRSEIIAPYAGTVEKLAFTSIGDVVTPAQPIMEIVPDGDEMVVEAAISPADVDQVQAGDSAAVRLSAFNRATTPELVGTVVYVATDLSENAERTASFFNVRIKLDQKSVGAEKLTLRNGMPAEVHIFTGDRSLLSYLTKPLRDQFARAFRDNP